MWMLFSKSNNFTVTPTILTFNGNNIEMVSSYRYLGVWLDTNLSFKCHVDNLTAMWPRRQQLPQTRSALQSHFTLALSVATNTVLNI